jgi:dolichol kinase
MTPNPSIERTSKRLRLLAAAHVERLGVMSTPMPMLTESAAVRLARATRTLAWAKGVSLVCVVLCLLIVNTELLPYRVAFASVVALLLVGGCAVIVGIRAVALIPKLERQASAYPSDAANPSLQRTAFGVR